MKYVECPQVYEGKEKSLFMAGGITGCRNWSKDLVEMLKETDLTLLNPRRKNYNPRAPNIAREQITWEFYHLAKASVASFWFPPETLCPITLYELGKKTAKTKPLFIGIDPNYARKIDIEIQTELDRPEVKIVYSLEELAEQIKNWSAKN